MTTEYARQLLPPGTLLHNGDYRVERHLGSGGFGNTYQVTKVSFNESFAMKEFFMKDINLRSEETVSVNTPANEGTFESQKRKFAREARRLHDISHEHIVHVEDFFEENGTAYYVMEYIDGESLAEHATRSGKPFSEAETIKIARQMAEALQFIHGKRMLHLDIKPSNIMLDKSGEATLIDFGASKQFATGESTSVSSSTLEFSHSYAPGELLSGNKDSLGPWTDFYSLGATLYNMLTMKKPPTYQEIVNSGDSAFSYTHPVSSDMKDFIAKMMQPKMASRPQSAQEVLSLLNRLSSHSKAKLWGWVWMALSAIVLAAIVGVGCFYLGQRLSSTPSTEPAPTAVDTTVVEESKPKTEKKKPKAEKKTVATANTVKEKGKGKGIKTIIEKMPPKKKNDEIFDLGYGTWEGELKNGKPDGYGKLKYRQRRLIEERDPQAHTAEAGDWLVGEYKNGHLSQGTLHRKNSDETILIDIGE